jgi:hypothetical protein
MSDAELDKVEAIWVNTAEGAEITGYNPQSLKNIAYKMAQEPEDQRVIKVRRRSSRWELWLPDLMLYVNRQRPGPILKSKKSDSPAIP